MIAMNRVACLVLLLLLHVSPGQAETYYVRTDGSDADAGLSDLEPLKTIAKAARLAKPGDVVIVGPGTYDERVDIGGHGNAAERTVFRAEVPGKTVLDGEEQQFRFSVRRPKVSIIGFVCRSSREHALDFNEGADDGLVQGCTLVDNKLDGAFFRKCKGGRVESTVCARNGRHGIWFLQNEGGEAVSNTLYANRGSGLSLDGTPGVVAFRNIIAHNGVGIRLSKRAVGSTVSDYNLLAGGFLGGLQGSAWLFGARAGTLGDWRELSGLDAHSIAGDPMLRDPDRGDFSPLAPPRGNRSPALRADLCIARLRDVPAPAADLTGKTARPALGAVWLADEPRGRPFATLDVPSAARVSVAVTTADGGLVRSLLSGYPAAQGKLGLYWDGRDDRGGAAPPGRYAWRAIVHNVCGTDDGSVGDVGDPPYGRTQVSDGVCDLAVDASGDLYEMSFWDESGHCLRKRKADGAADWVIPFYIRNTAGGLGTAVATDGKYVFGALVKQGKHPDGGRSIADHVRRLFANSGAPADYPGEKPDNLIVVNDVKPEAWIHAQRHGTEQARRLFSIRGLAVDGRRLFISNYYRDRVEIFDKETGQKLSEFTVPKPLGLDVAQDGTLWVANSGDRVSQFAIDGTRKADIAPLKDPYGVTFGGPDRHLYVTEMGTGRILEYAPGRRLVRTLGQAAAGPGPVLPKVFRWHGYCGIAVDPQGRISVTDKGNHRVQRFQPDGSPWQSLYSDFVAAPFVDLRSPDVLLSGTRQYRVDYDTGKWAFTHNWQPADGRFATNMLLRRRLPNGRDYLFHLGGHRMGVVVYAIEGDGLRRAAMLGGRWTGLDDLGKGDEGGRLFWIDTDGDGQVEEAEITWETAARRGVAYIALAPGWWVDDRGDCWLAEAMSQSIVRLRRQGFDERANPRYDWGKLETVVTRDTSPWKFEPKNLRVAPGGDLYVQGTVEGRRDLGAFWMGGTAIARYAPDGHRRWVRPLPRVAVALATDGDFWYVGEGPTAKISAYTKDGLFVADMAPGRPSGYQTGWIDHAMGIFAFVHPRTKGRYVYAEEDLFGKMIRYRIEGADAIQSQHGSFMWPAADGEAE
jgi:sugar lactone lactonase YvrE